MTMTIKELKEMFDGKYEDIEVYSPNETGAHYPTCFHTDNCNFTENYNEESEIGLYELMDEEYYNNSVMINTCEDADFEELYGNKEARVLCLMLK